MRWRSPWRSAHFGNVRALAIDETSRARGHDDITLAADAAKRRARGFASVPPIKTVIFLIAGKLDCAAVNPHAR